jgi:hypothetical protein
MNRLASKKQVMLRNEAVDSCIALYKSASLTQAVECMGKDDRILWKIGRHYSALREHGMPLEE